MSVRDTKRGLFIAVEGMDGSGKTQGTKALAGYLLEEGLNFVQTREIGGTPFSEKIRSMMFDSKNPIDPLTRLLCALTARQQHVTDVIKPAIAAGQSVLTDRFFDSTFVYQGVVDNQMSMYYELAATRTLQHLFVRPDITVFLLADPEVAFERGTARTDVDNDQYKRSLDVARKVAKGYQMVIDRLTIEQRKNAFVVDCNRPLEEVFKDLRMIAHRIVQGYENPYP